MLNKTADTVSPMKSEERETDKIIHAVEAKIAGTVLEVKDSSDSEKVPYSKILMTFADCTDKTYLYIGYTMAIVSGFALPSFTFIFGDIVNGIGGSNPDGVINQSKTMLYIGCGVAVTCYTYVAFLSILAERIALKTKI